MKLSLLFARRIFVTVLISFKKILEVSNNISSILDLKRTLRFNRAVNIWQTGVSDSCSLYHENTSKKSYYENLL